MFIQLSIFVTSSAISFCIYLPCIIRTSLCISAREVRRWCIFAVVATAGRIWGVRGALPFRIAEAVNGGRHRQYRILAVVFGDEAVCL